MASSSRFFFGAFVARSSTNRRAMAAMSSMACMNTASLAFDGAVKPLNLRTNCNDAARTSSSVAGGSKLKRVLMFRHMALHLGNFRERETRAFLLGVLLGAAGALRQHDAVNHHFDVKQLVVVGTEFAGDPIRRQRP